MLAGLRACTDRELSHARVVVQTGSVAAARSSAIELHRCSVSLHTSRLTGSGALDVLHACVALRLYSLSKLHQLSQQAVSVCEVKLSSCMGYGFVEGSGCGERSHHIMCVLAGVAAAYCQEVSWNRQTVLPGENKSTVPAEQSVLLFHTRICITLPSGHAG